MAGKVLRDAVGKRLLWSDGAWEDLPGGVEARGKAFEVGEPGRPQGRFWFPLRKDGKGCNLCLFEFSSEKYVRGTLRVLALTR